MPIKGTNDIIGTLKLKTIIEFAMPKYRMLAKKNKNSCDWCNLLWLLASSCCLYWDCCNSSCKWSNFASDLVVLIACSRTWSLEKFWWALNECGDLHMWYVQQSNDCSDGLCDCCNYHATHVNALATDWMCLRFRLRQAWNLKLTQEIARCFTTNCR